MIGKALLALAVLMADRRASAYALYVRNPPPSVPTLSADETARSGKPVVVKLHAQWCAVCMLTKDVWTDINPDILVEIESTAAH